MTNLDHLKTILYINNVTMLNYGSYATFFKTMFGFEKFEGKCDKKKVLRKNKSK